MKRLTELITAVGSPPLARGTLRAHPRRLLDLRLTPARAGNTAALAFEVTPPTAHPRSRGEHAEGQREPCPLCGSPPLARGTRSPAAPLHRSARLTPARAGNTDRRGRGCASGAAHPRSRGEHGPAWSQPVTNCGSPPLARGTRYREGSPRRRNRLTPARAGNTLTLCDCRALRPAHPRSRGEHLTPLSAKLIRPGSPPLARGTLSTRARGIEIIRLTPARAGNTFTIAIFRLLQSAHPRSRGEHNYYHSDY